MPKLRIDDQFVDVPEGATVLDAANAAGIAIPTLCHRPGKPHITACMVCVVLDKTSGAMLPACSARAEAGMWIDTNSDGVRAARCAALELLLSDHVGDCEGPCQRICPAHMNIPLMIRQIAALDFSAALITVKRDIALPAILGRICPAPCEAGCRRRQLDEPVAICLLKRFVADLDLDSAAPYRPACAPDTGHAVAIIGAGPTGLAAAYYLRLRGHACTLFDANPQPGGALRSDVPTATLPRDVLDAEIAGVLALGVVFRGNKRVGHEVSLEILRRTHAAVIVATGPIAAPTAAGWGLAYAARGLAVDRATFATSATGVFAGGSALAPSRLAVRAVGHGKDMAGAIDAYLRSGTPAKVGAPFNSVIGKLRDAELAVVQQEGAAIPRVAPQYAGSPAGYAAQEATREASRCLHCDCRKNQACRLRTYAQDYDARQTRFKPAMRRAIEQVRTHPTLIFEQRKCIACGICVQITQEYGEPLGISFINRGADTRIGVPDGAPLEHGLTIAAAACVEACPTGALAFRDNRAADG
jgi:ferredoxin